MNKIKRIETKEQTEKKRQRNQLIVGGILVLMMIFGTAGYAFMSNEGTGKTTSSSFIEYKGLKFYHNNGYWSFTSENQAFVTEYNPNETIDIAFSSKKSVSDYKDKVLYFVTDSGEPNIELYRNLAYTTKRISMACLPGEACTGNDPVKNCSTDNIIIIREPRKNESPSIIDKEKCVFITADSDNQTKYADSFLFDLLGIK